MNESERKVVDALLAALPAHEYTVHANVEWMAFADSPAGRAQGEADVVICHPKKGVLVLEVKTGGIEIDAAQDAVWSIDRKGARHRIDDPLKQAQASARHILDLGKRDATLSPSNKGLPVPVGGAAVLPHVRWKKELPLRWPEDLVLDAGDLTELRTAVDRAFTYWATRFPPRGVLDTAQWRRLNQVLSPRTARAMTLKATLEAEEKELVELTNQQIRALEMLRLFPRLKVRGCAGSGKSLLAAAEARRLASEGTETLLLVFNRRLAAALSQTLGANSHLTVCTFHQLCRDICAAAGVTPPAPPEGGNDATYWREVLPALAFEHLGRFAQRFGAVLVDEGQDFYPDWWALIELLLSPQGRLVVLYDPNQDIFHTGGAIPIDGPPAELTVNCRSTAAINRAACAVGDLAFPSASGPVEGEPPELVEYARPEDLERLVGKRLKRLLHDEHLASRDVVIVSPRRRAHSALGTNARIGDYTLVEETPSSQHEVLYATLQSFKGLEASVVLLVDLDLDHATCAPRNLYVAFSRAKHRLVLYVRAEQAERLRGALK
jgi:hypothetical protein